VLVGLIWGGLWHGYADYFGLGGKGWATWPLIVLQSPVLLTAWSLVLTRVYERTGGNLLLAMLMHATIPSSALVLGQHYGSIEEELRWTAVSVALAWIAAGIFWIASRRSSASL
jgi:uncharacterized protein